MSEERTQAPSQRRRHLARRQGQVVHSPALTAAVGWLVAVTLLGVLGDGLAQGLTDIVRSSLEKPPVVSAQLDAVVAQVRDMVLGVAWPLTAILAGFAGGALAAHQLQVRGLWATALVAPKPARLWAFSGGPGLAVRAQESAWGVIKAVVLVAVCAWIVRAGWVDFLRQSELEGPNLARGVARIALHLAQALGAVLLALGGVDYMVRYRRFESMLRTTTQEQREDQHVMEGDPAGRAQRRQVARRWRGDSPDLLTGASLLLNGPGGLTLVLTGGPPPRRVTVRAVVRGGTALRLRRLPEASGIPQVDAPDLAQRLARRPMKGSPIAAELFAELAAIWPPA